MAEIDPDNLVSRLCIRMADHGIVAKRLTSADDPYGDYIVFFIPGQPERVKKSWRVLRYLSVYNPNKMDEALREIIAEFNPSAARTKEPGSEKERKPQPGTSWGKNSPVPNRSNLSCRVRGNDQELRQRRENHRKALGYLENRTITESIAIQLQ